MSRKSINIFIAIACYGFIAYRIIDFSNFNLFSNINFSSKNFIYILLIQLFLFAVNISLESLKWQLLMNKYVKLSFINSLKSVLAGFSSGIITPAHLGEPIGRLSNIDKKYIYQGVTLNYFSGFTLNAVVFIIGFICLFLIPVDFNFNKNILLILIAIIFLIVIIVRIMRKKIINWNKHLIKITNSVKDIGIYNFIKLIIYSFARFCIYSTQLLIMLYYFSGFSINYEIIYYIPIYFMFITIPPSFILTDLGIRGSVGLFLFNKIGVADNVIIISVFALWLINHSLPAIWGNFFILKNKNKN